MRRAERQPYAQRSGLRMALSQSGYDYSQERRIKLEDSGQRW
jgi:hypothetical protein